MFGSVKKIKDRNSNYCYWPLLMIFLIGLFLRVYDLSNESIWYDEAFSIVRAKFNLSQIFFRPENSPPLYYIILHGWINLFGDSEFSVRFPSVLFGSLSILMVYKVGNQIFDKDVGVLSSLLLGLSVFHIRYSQEARTYSLSVLLTLLSMYFFIKLLRKTSYKVLFGYILYSTLLLYSHLYGLFIIISQNIYIIALFLLSKETFELNLKRWVLIQILLIILFIPWVSIFITQTFKVLHSGFWISTPSLYSIAKSFKIYSGSTLLFLLFIILSPFSIMMYEKISGNFRWKIFFQSIEFFQWKVRLLNTDKIFLLLVWLLTPIILPFIFSQFSTPIYYTKYTIVASLAFYLLVSKAISNIHYKYLKTIVVSVVIVLSMINILKYYTKINKEQWRDVAYYINTDAIDGDLVLFNGYTKLPFDYYSNRTDLIKKPFPKIGRQVDEENIKELEPTVEGYKRVWVILSNSKDEKELISKKLIEAYSFWFQKEYTGIKLYFFEKRE